jgi:hypothetical protein
MASKKTDAQQARAQQLRAEIKDLAKKSRTAPPEKESPAAFVHRRMAELDAEKEQGSKPQ